MDDKWSTQSVRIIYFPIVYWRIYHCPEIGNMDETLSKTNVYKVNKKIEVKLDVYCYEGECPSYAKLWMQTFVVLKGGDDVTLYEAQNETAVEEKFRLAQKSWTSLLVPLIPWKQENIYISPFQKSCVGVVTKDAYTISFEAKYLDYRLVLMTAIGIILFIFADTLSRNVLFYYTTGISVGILASFLIILFIVSRFVPKRTGAVAFFTAGSSVTLYFLQYLYKNISDVLQEYSRYVIGYFITAGLISFAFCYWRGPVTNVRTLNLIKWSIQLMSLVLIYNSVQIVAMSIFILAAMVTLHNFPYFVIEYFTRLWVKRFPPKIQLLSPEEYVLEGEMETRKALEKLRDYCRSPDCNAWKTVSRLQSPTRFASFIEGSPHLTREEIEAYESDPNPPEFGDSDDERFDDSIDHTLNSP